MGIVEAISSFFKAIGAMLGLIDDEKKRQAGRDEAAVKQFQEMHDAEQRKKRVKRPSADDVTDSLRNDRF